MFEHTPVLVDEALRGLGLEGEDACSPRDGLYVDATFGRGGHTARILAALDAVSAETGATLAQSSLAWLMTRPSLTAPIASATSAEQLKELLGALSLSLTPAQIESLDQASAAA